MDPYKDNTQNNNPVAPPQRASDQTGGEISLNSALNPNQSSTQTIMDESIMEIENLDRKVIDSKMPEQLKESARRSIERLRRMAKRGSYSGEFESVDKYIYWITSIPWGLATQDNLDIENAKRIMDSTHFGMNTVKDLILDYLAVMQLNKNSNQQANTNVVQGQEMAVLRGSSANAPVLLFTGLQGVGKTSIAKSIAMAMGRKFARVSLGALGSVQALRGQSKAFLDAEPSQIVKAIVRTGTMNPVILLDEIDKVSGSSGLLADVMAALLEILDPEQNSHFIDHYIDYPIDLSNVFFICTSNNLGSLSAALLDRLEVIRFTSYSDEEKITIAKNYSLPKVIQNTGIPAENIVIEEEVWPLLVRPVGFDAGLRQLERNLATLVRSAARQIIEKKPVPIRVTKDNLTEFVLPDQGPLS